MSTPRAIDKTSPVVEARPLFFQDAHGDIVRITYFEKDGVYQIRVIDTDPDPDKKDAHDCYIIYQAGRPGSGEIELKTMQAYPKGAGGGTFLIDLLLTEGMKSGEYNTIRTLNTNPEAFPFYRSLRFVGDEKSGIVRGKSKDREGNEVDEKGCIEWCVGLTECKSAITAKTKFANTWRAIPSEYNEILTHLTNLGAMNAKMRAVIKENPARIVDVAAIALPQLVKELSTLVNAHLAKIGTGFNLRNQDTIAQKQQVLTLCKYYLEGKINRSQLLDCIQARPKYAVAIGTSETKAVVDLVLDAPRRLQKQMKLAPQDAGFFTSPSTPGVPIPYMSAFAPPSASMSNTITIEQIESMFTGDENQNRETLVDLAVAHGSPTATPETVTLILNTPALRARLLTGTLDDVSRSLKRLAVIHSAGATLILNNFELKAGLLAGTPENVSHALEDIAICHEGPAELILNTLELRVRLLVGNSEKVRSSLYSIALFNASAATLILNTPELRTRLLNGNPDNIGGDLRQLALRYPKEATVILTDPGLRAGFLTGYPPYVRDTIIDIARDNTDATAVLILNTPELRKRLLDDNPDDIIYNLTSIAKAHPNSVEVQALCVQYQPRFPHHHQP